MAGLGEGACEAEADAVRGIGALVGERIGADGCRPLVGDVEVELTVDTGGDHGDLPATVAERVVDEHVDDVTDRLGVDRHPPRRTGDRDRPPGGSGGRIPDRHAVAQPRGHVTLFRCAVGVAGEREQAGDGRLQPVELSDALAQHLARVVPGHGQLGLDGDPHRGHGCAQLV